MNATTTTETTTADARVFWKFIQGVGNLIGVATTLWAAVSWVFGQTSKLPLGPPEYSALIGASLLGLVMLNRASIKRHPRWRPKQKLFALLGEIVLEQHYSKFDNSEYRGKVFAGRIEARSSLKAELDTLGIDAPPANRPHHVWIEYLTELHDSAQAKDIKAARSLWPRDSST